VWFKIEACCALIALLISRLIKLLHWGGGGAPPAPLGALVIPLLFLSEYHNWRASEVSETFLGDVNGKL